MVQPNFPIRVWDGLSARTERTSLSNDQWPNHQDWNQIVAEVRSIESVLLSTDKVTYISKAIEDINTGDIIDVRADSFIQKANASVGKVCGIALNTVTSGEFILFTSSGVIELNSFNMLPGSIYYLKGIGKFSSMPPTNGWIVQIGKSLETNILDFNIKQSIRL